MKTNMDEMAQEIRRIAVEHGWESTTRSFGEEVALWHSECSEALEEHRNGHQENEIYFGPEICTGCNLQKSKHFESNHAYEHDWTPARKPEGIPIEAADVIIRIMHWAARVGVSLDEAIQIKAMYNITRPFRHGNKTL